MSMSIEETKAEVWRQIREIQERHQKELEPLLKILCDIQALEPPAPVLIDFMALTDEQKEEWRRRIKSSGVQIDEA